MAGSAIIGALRVVLGADAANFETGLKQAQDQLAKFSTGMVAVGTAIGAALAGMAAKVGSAVKGALDEISQLGKLAAATGVPIEQLSALAYAAKEAGASTETLGAGLKGLGQSMVEAAGNARSDAARAFAALGIAVRDAAGQLRPVNDVLLDLAAKFRDMPNGAQKAAIATTLLKDAGVDLIGVLNRGRDWIAAMGDEAAKLGIVIDGDTRAAVKSFRENVKDVGNTVEAFIVQLAARLAPTLEKISNAFLTLTKSGDSLNAVGMAVSVTLKTLATGGELLVGIFSILTEAVRKVSTSLSLLLSGEFRKAFATVGEGFRNIDNIITSTDNSIAALWSGWDTLVKKAGEDTATALAPAPESIKQMRDRLAEARAQLQAMIEAPIGTIAEKMLAVEEATRKGLLTAAQELQMSQQILQQYHKDARAALDLLLNTPTETFAAKMEAVNAAVANGTVAMRDYGAIVKRINDENRQNWLNLASSAASALQTIFGKNKAAGIAAAIINTGVAITKAMELPWPFNWAQAALVAATGAAQIATIKSANLSGGGAAPAVAGGRGGGGGGEGAAPPAQSLFVQGINPGDFFSGAAVRDLAEKLLAFQRDGGKVVIA